MEYTNLSRGMRNRRITQVVCGIDMAQVEKPAIRRGYEMAF
jgi:hypothetical protein